LISLIHKHNSGHYNHSRNSLAGLFAKQMLYNFSIKFQDTHNNSIVIAIRITDDSPTAITAAADTTIAAIHKIT
jgi:hypothetical protein